MRRRSAVVWGALLLGGCATSTVKRSPQFWSGRLGLQVFSEPPQSYQASFELQGSAQEGELTLLSPLGGVLARLQWNAQQATLERGNERWQQANVDQLTRQLTAAAIPIAALFDWLQGQPSSDADWTVDLSAHADGKILAQRLNPLPRAQLRLLLDR